ncbi:MAG: hypothetical protein OdinLCB4_006255 [Candidatus Odinarchaeum yellowstonii]|uniref:Uncharacterized protein n=1 Tax=Odinarchaeota yellowstonii (strain LCB_4) TaxID=1841599 RepID=A0AAF0D1S6_ODILC|nr:MAG: hypothetical protein OdinLCB4_006255 [Candidatus Odinarchaeum yellowstonii]
MRKEEITSSVKKIVNGLLASIGVVLIQVLLFLISLNYFNTLSSITLLILVSLESILLYIIYLSYKLIILEEHILPETVKTRTFLKTILWYIILNASLQITRASLLVVLSSNIINGVETTSNILYVIDMLALLTVAPLLLYVISWSLMIYISLKDVNVEYEIKPILTATASLMLISIISYIIYHTAGTIVMIIAFLTQAYLFLKISKKADTDSRRKLEHPDNSIKQRTLRKS